MNRFARLAPEPMPSVPANAEMKVELKTARELERERRDFKRDRLGRSTYGRTARITYLAHARGYVMARYPGCVPFVIPEDQWRGFPFYGAETEE